MSNYSKVLLAEDESIVLLSFKSFLKKLGYNVVAEARTGDDAVRLCNETHPDFAIMDINMPGINGIQALELINASRSSKLPCIFVTAYSDESLIQKAGIAGAYSYLIKPIQIDDLRAAIDITLHQHEQYLQLTSEALNAKEALENRKIVERAKGYLMDSFGMKEKDAMQFLQKKSNESNKKVVDVARSILHMSEELS